MSIKSTLKRPYFRNLDGLRGLFIILIFISHGCAHHAPEVNEHWLAPLIHLGVVHNSALVLSFFFVMSSFLITSLLLRERHLDGRIHIGAFYLRRTLRIWPLYYAILAFAFIGYPFLRSFGSHGYTIDVQIWHYIVFIQNLDLAAGRFPENMSLAVTWSLAVEEQFYLLWPLLLAFIPVHRLFPAMLLLLTATLSWQFVNGNNYFHTLTCASDLIVGSLLAIGVFYAQHYRHGLARRWLLSVRRLPRVAVAALWLWSLYLYRHGLSEGPVQLMPFERLVVDLTAGLVLMEQNYGRYSLFKLGNVKGMRYLGQLAFGMYLLHAPILTALSDIYHLLGWQKTAWDSVFIIPLLAFGLTVGTATLCFRYFELPFLRLYSRFLPRSKRPAEGPANQEKTQPVSA